MCVGDPGATSGSGTDPRVVFIRGGAVSLSVRLAGGAGAAGARLCGHQVRLISKTKQIGEVKVGK